MQTANATVKFSGNCTAFGFSTTPAAINSGEQFIIFLTNPLIQENTTVQFYVSQTGSGPSAQINVECEISQRS